MRVLHTGYGKSGSSWLYKIVRLSLEGAGHAYHGYWRSHPASDALTRMGHLGTFQGAEDIDCLEIGPSTFMYELGRTDAYTPILDLDDYVSKCRQIWTHAPASDRLGEVVQRVDRVVGIVRDVRDVAISTVHFNFSPTCVRQFPQRRRGYTSPQAMLDAEFANLVVAWSRHVHGYLRRLGSWPLHVVLYERLLADFDEEFDRLLVHLGLDLDSGARADIKARVSFESMHRASPDHVRAGTTGQWRDVLSPEQLADADRIAGPLLRLLGYPTVHGDPAAVEPAIPADIDWQGWREDPWPHVDLRGFRYPDVVRLYREAFSRVREAAIPAVAGWGADVCGRALVEAAAADGVTVKYVVDGDPALRGRRLGGVPIVGPDEIGRTLPILPFVVGSIGSIGAIEAEIRTRFAFAPSLRTFAPIPGRRAQARKPAAGQASETLRLAASA